MTYWDVPSGVVVHAGETVSLVESLAVTVLAWPAPVPALIVTMRPTQRLSVGQALRSEEHTSELQSPCNLVCRLLLEKKKMRMHIWTIRKRGHSSLTSRM